MIDGLFLYHNGAHSVKLLWKDFHHLFPETLLFTFFRSSSKRFWSSRQDPEARQINQQKFQVSNVPPWQLSQVRSSSVFGFLFWYCSKGIAWIASDWLKRSNLLALLNKKTYAHCQKRKVSDATLCTLKTDAGVKAVCHMQTRTYFRLLTVKSGNVSNHAPSVILYCIGIETWFHDHLLLIIIVSLVWCTSSEVRWKSTSH